MYYYFGQQILKEKLNFRGIDVQTGSGADPILKTGPASLFITYYYLRV